MPKFYHKVSINSGINLNLVSKTGTYTATVNDCILECDSSGGAFALNLPAVSGNSGLFYAIKKIDTSANKITVTASGAETIDGSTTYVLCRQWETLSIVCDGTRWLTVSLGVNALNIEATPVSDTSVSGVVSLLTAGENLAFGETVYIKSDGLVWKADANGSATYPCMGIAGAAISSAASGPILLHGIVRNDAWTWTVGGVIYISTTPGGLTHTQPAATDDVIQPVGIATHADRMYFNPPLTYITHT